MTELLSMHAATKDWFIERAAQGSALGSKSQWLSHLEVWPMGANSEDLLEQVQNSPISSLAYRYL